MYVQICSVSHALSRDVKLMSRVSNSLTAHFWPDSVAMCMCNLRQMLATCLALLQLGGKDAAGGRQ